MSVARVQNAAGGANAVSVTATLGATPTPGNLLIAWANSDALVTIGGSGWTAGPVVIDGNGAYAWWKIAGPSEPSGVTFTPSIPDWIVAGLLEYSGLTATPFDASGSSMISGTPSTSTTPVTVTTAADHELGIAMAHLHSGVLTEPTAPSWTGGYTNLVSQGMTAGGPTAVHTFVADNLDLGTAGSKSTACSWTTAWPDDQQLVLTFLVEPGAHGTAALASASALTADGHQTAHAAAAADAHSTLTADGHQLAHGAAAAGSASALTAAGRQTAHGTAAAAGHSTLTAAGRQAVHATAHLTSTSALTATAGTHSRRTPRPDTGTTPRP